MSLTKGLALLLTGLLISTGTQAMSDREKAIRNLQQPTSLAEVQNYARGKWTSIAVELRPTEDRTGSGKINPTFLKRDFSYLDNNRFAGSITLFGDNYGQLPLMRFDFKGHLKWGREHPIAKGAWEVDYVLDEGFEVTPFNEQTAQMLNQAPAEGVAPFQANVAQSILKKPFPMFNLLKDQIVSDYDLIYFTHGMLFMGAKHVDGKPFDKPENRPHQLQIPLVRVD